MSGRGHAAGGATLVELLVGLLATSLVVLALHATWSAAARAQHRLTAAAAAQDAAATAAALVADDLREAGYDPRSAGLVSLTWADGTGVALGRDLSADGDTGDRNERIAYRFDPEAERLTRRQGTAPPQPMLDGVERFALRYFDEDGTPLPRGPLSAAERAAVRRVAIVLAVRRAAGHGQPDARAVQRAGATLRNAS